MVDKAIGYYIVKFYNTESPKVCFWNGGGFEAFMSDSTHDEIERVESSLEELVVDAHYAGQSEFTDDEARLNMARAYAKQMLGR
jgi:hypothetical protein